MGFLAGELFEDVAFWVGEWRVEEEVEILGVWDRDGGQWCGLTHCGDWRKEGCKDETKL